MARLKQYSEEGYLRPVPPFDLARSLDYLERFAPMRGDQTISDGKLTKAITIHERAIAFRIESIGSIEDPRLRYVLFSDHPLQGPIMSVMKDKISFFLSLDDDLGPFYRAGYKDEKFEPIIEELYGYHQVKFPTPFDGTCWAILTERNAIPIARNEKVEIDQRYGSCLELDGRIYRAFPEPSKLSGVSLGDLTQITRNQKRAEYLLSASSAFLNVDECFLREGGYDQVSSWLDSIKGIGPWYAAFIMLRALGRMEHIPAGERSLLKAASRAYGIRLDPESVKRIADRYGLMQGYWAHYLSVASLMKSQ